MKSSNKTNRKTLFVVEGVDSDIDDWVSDKLGLEIGLRLNDLVLNIGEGFDLDHFSSVYFRSWQHFPELVSAFALYFQLQGKRVINSNLSADFRANKLRQLLRMQDLGIQFPKSYLLSGWDRKILDNILKTERGWGKLVLKRLDSRQNKGNFLYSQDISSNSDENELFNNYFLANKSFPLLAQEYIPIQQDYRKVFVDYKPVLSFERRREYRNQAKFAKLVETKNIELKLFPEKLLTKLETYLKAEGLEFSAVDLVEYEGEWYVYEVNSQPGLRNLDVVAELRDIL